MKLADLRQISQYEWEIPQTHRPDMLGAVRLFADVELLDPVLNDKSLEQAVNAATLPGLVGSVIVMPDVHQGYGFPIGGVAATAFPDGAISPGAIGYDINCGVRLLASQVELATAQTEISNLAALLDEYCPSGVGKTGTVSLALPELRRVLESGSAWALQRGYAEAEDLERTEDRGRIEGAIPDSVSVLAQSRGRPQIGSLGAGNHFIEVDVVDRIFEEAAAAAFGLRGGCLTIQIHCGSRGLGHQVCTDFVKQFQGVTGKYGFQVPDRELVCAPIRSAEGKAYLGAMRAAANFAFANRQLLAHSARRAFEQVFRRKTAYWQLVQVYDVAHNIAKIETHDFDGGGLRVCVHRKGATRAFGPHSAGLPAAYADVGQPVLVPGSMGTGSWVLAGTQASMRRSLGSACHGAGRVWSRSRARKEVRGSELRNSLEDQGIVIRAGSLAGLAEEAPAAYKDVDSVVRVVTGAGIARAVARLRPLAVIKG
jgi:tRNA-splicing ligase RtcB (3'-phosphate/5'-hydroxy nucleic acid ligase)